MLIDVSFFYFYDGRCNVEVHAIDDVWQDTYGRDSVARRAWYARSRLVSFHASDMDENCRVLDSIDSFEPESDGEDAIHAFLGEAISFVPECA